MQAQAKRLSTLAGGLIFYFLIPRASAQSSQAAAEWALFNQILLIGMVVGIIVFGLLFYAVIRYREKAETPGAK